MSLLTQLGINLITHGFGDDYSTYANDLTEEEYQYIRRHRLTRNGRSSSNKNLKQFAQVYVGLLDGDKSVKNASQQVEYVKSRLPRVHAQLNEALLREGLRGNDFDVELNVDEWKFLTFIVKVDSTDKLDITYEFVIQLDDDTKLAIRGVPTQKGVVVRVPPMRDKITDGIYIASLRVMTDTHIFTPLMLRVSVIDTTSAAIKECIEELIMPARKIKQSNRKLLI